jgi:hypothetical protein
MRDISSDHHKNYFTNDISVLDQRVTFGVHCVILTIVLYFPFILKIDIIRNLFLILNGTSLEFL